MQTKAFIAIAKALLLITGCLGGAWALGADFDLDLAAGYAWDDNVGLDELERATGESDEVTTLEIQGSALAFRYSFVIVKSVRSSPQLRRVSLPHRRLE